MVAGVAPNAGGGTDDAATKAAVVVDPKAGGCDVLPKAKAAGLGSTGGGLLVGLLKLNPPVDGCVEAPKENAVVVFAASSTPKALDVGAAFKVVVVLSNDGFGTAEKLVAGVATDGVVDGLKFVAETVLPNVGSADAVDPPNENADVAVDFATSVAVFGGAVDVGATDAELPPNENVALGVSVTAVVDAGVLAMPNENGLGGSVVVMADVVGTMEMFPNESEAATAFGASVVTKLFVVVGPATSVVAVFALPNENVVLEVSTVFGSSNVVFSGLFCVLVIGIKIATGCATASAVDNVVVTGVVMALTVDTIAIGFTGASATMVVSGRFKLQLLVGDVPTD